jgi:hypothetical protein
MIRERVLTISMLLPLMALSGVAHAGSTISDKSYWPNEARSSRVYVVEQTDPNFARAMQSGVTLPQAALGMIGGQQRCGYQGGPKSSYTCSK